MPGAPNRPPPEAAAPAPAPPTREAPARGVLRRLVPSHVALLQDSWKGPLPPELLLPFEKAEGAYRAGDVVGATGALDLLAIRFAEPRWPSLPEPYRRLRVRIPAPVPPHWDPDHGLPAEEKEARKARRAAEDQLALATGAVSWAAAHGCAPDGLAAEVERLRAALASGTDLADVTAGLDGVWETLQPRLPRPKSGAPRPAPPPPADGADTPDAGPSA
jgi:hypothetical protein